MGFFSTPKSDDYMPQMAEPLDASKRYDIVHLLNEDRCLVFRNIKFMGRRSVTGGNKFSVSNEMILIELENGTEVCLSPFSLVAVYEHGKEASFEIRSFEELSARE